MRAGNTALAAGDAAGTEAALNAVLAMTGVLGLDDAGAAGAASSGPERAALDALVQARLQERADARSQRDWARADAIRDALSAAGIAVEDTADGATWSVDAS